MPHICSHYSLFFRHRLIPVPRKTFFTSTAAYISIHTSLQALLLMWRKRKWYSAVSVQFVLGSKISQIGRQYVLILLMIKNLFTSLLGGVSLLSCNMLFQKLPFLAALWCRHCHFHGVALAVVFLESAKTVFVLVLLVHPDVWWHNYYLGTNNHKISLQRVDIF